MKCDQLCQAGLPDFGIGKQCAGFHPEGKSPHLCEEHLRDALLTNMKEMMVWLRVLRDVENWLHTDDKITLAAVIDKNEPIMELAA